MIIENKLIDLPEITENIYLKLKEKYGITARATRFLEMFKYAFQVDEWVLLDERLMANGQFDSYMMDKLFEFMNSKTVNTEDIYKAILTAGEFVQSEKRLFESGQVDEIIWAIFLAITNNNK